MVTCELKPVHAMQEATHDSKTYLKYYDVAKEVEVAKSLLKKTGVIENTDDTGALSKRMAVMLLYRSAACCRSSGGARVVPHMVSIGDSCYLC